ncbi:hypothetical protein, partial [Bradyrhizobium canariense]|uniref:hypothetical protein n=1 Tax=Bradyrhizobium canariense TaxID=255045 RepID=UPI001AECF315
VVCATPSLTVARPAKPFAPVWPSVRPCPARVRDDRDTPLFLGRVAATHTSFPNFGKVEYFQRRALTDSLGVLPDGQCKGS